MALTSLEKALKRRGYDLGERNPKTLPGSGKDAEMPSENHAASLGPVRSTDRLSLPGCRAGVIDNDSMS